VIRVRMCKQYCIEARKRIEGDTWGTDASEEFPERWIEIGVREDPHPADFN
jgi:hypothetical protein